MMLFESEEKSSKGDCGDSPRAQLVRKWTREVKDTVQQDSWGQVVEAAEGYERLAEVVPPKLENMSLSRTQRTTINMCLVCLSLRARGLLGKEDEGEMPPLTKMQEIVEVFEGVFVDTACPFFDPNLTAAKLHSLSFDAAGSPCGKKRVVEQTGDDVDEDSKDGGGGSRGGTLLAPPAPQRGKTHFSVHIEKVGLKDAQTYIHPFLSVSVIDGGGNVMEQVQDTPWAQIKKPNFVILQSTVHFQTPLELMRELNCAIFFEFKHYKPKKSKVSCRCWSFFEMDEVRPGPTQLEIYKKPMDPRRKKIRLHSVKKLYMHIDQQITGIA